MRSISLPTGSRRWRRRSTRGSTESAARSRERAPPSRPKSPLLRRQLGALDVERQRHAEEAAAAQERIASLEAEGETLRASLAEAVKEIAGLRYELARDRAWHRMVEERKFAPVTEVVAIEQARRRTQAAIEGT